MDTPAPAEPPEGPAKPQKVVIGRLSAEQERAMHLGMASTRRDMLAGHDGVLAKVEVERHLVLLAGRSFSRAVCDARAEGFGWEQIAEHVPSFTAAYGAEAGEKLFESVSIQDSRLERHFSWRCGDCGGLVLDAGPYGGHPADTEPGHRDGCGRLARDASAYVAGLGDPDLNDESAVLTAWSATNDLRELPPSCRPIEFQAPALEL